MSNEKRIVIVCHGVTPEMTCRFNGACYGEICIAPGICRKADADLTDEDKANVESFAKSEAEGWSTETPPANDPAP